MLTNIASRILALPKVVLLTGGAISTVAIGGGAVAFTQYVSNHRSQVSESQKTQNGVTAELKDDAATPKSNTSSGKADAKKPEASKNTKTDPKKSNTAKKPAAPSSGSGSSGASPAPTPPTSSCPNANHTPGGSDGSGGCWPYAGNTGVPAGTALTAYTGPCSIFTNTVIQDKTVNCALQMYNDASLTIRRSVVNGFIENTYTSGVGKLIVEDSEVHAGAWSEGAIWGSSMTVTRSEATGGQHSVHCESDCTVTDSWLHNQYNPDGGSYHNNAFISNGGTNMLLRHNTLHCTALLNATDGGCTGDLTLLGDFDTISYVTAESNLFMANNSSISYCTYGGHTPGKPYPNGHHVAYRNNVFQRGPNGKCGVYGAVTSFNPSASGNVWTGNIWSDGATLSP
jgi:hypothetical protein